MKYAHLTGNQINPFRDALPVEYSEIDPGTGLAVIPWYETQEIGKKGFEPERQMVNDGGTLRPVRVGDVDSSGQQLRMRVRKLVESGKGQVDMAPILDGLLSGIYDAKQLKAMKVATKITEAKKRESGPINVQKSRIKKVKP